MDKDKASASMIDRTKLVVRLLSVAWHQRPLAVIGFFIGAVVQTAASVLAIYATAQLGGLLARYVTGGSTEEIWFWLVVDILSAVLMGLGFWYMTFCKRLLYFKITTWATYEFLGALNRIDMPDYYESEMRNVLNKAANGYSWQISNVVETCLDLIFAFMRFGAMAIVVAQINWWLIPLIALFLIPSLINESQLSRVQWFVWDEKGDNRHVFWKLDWLARQPFGQFELRAMQARKYIVDKINAMNRSFYKRQENIYKKVSRVTVPAKILEALSVAVGSVVLIRQFLAGSISFENYLFLSGGLLRIVTELNNIFGTLSRLQEPILFTENFFKLTDRQPTHTDKPGAVRIDNKKPPVIEFQNLSFHYPGQADLIFDNLNLAIEQSEHIAIVGENGAGKSTLIKLLLRFYKPTSGKILINGIDLEGIAIESWYENIAILLQTFNYYPFPIDENIEIARPGEHSPDRLNKAAKLGGVNDMVKDYPYGWETVLDASFKKGIEPSGGQWQRVGLARAFYRDANVLILDEPTSAIDAKAEYEIFNNIFKTYKDKTAVIISHRFSTVRRADRIVVLDKGKVVEEGSHKQLMQKQGLYHEMFTKQAEGYK